jgi:hypothetical protein
LSRGQRETNVSARTIESWGGKLLLGEAPWDTIPLVTTGKADVWGFLLLVPALAITGASGFRMAGTSTDPRIVSKKRRMPFIAGNGLLVLIPAALYLASLASRGEFGTNFYIVQAIELVAGAVNITLMSLNVRDGFRLTGRLPAKS